MLEFDDVTRQINQGYGYVRASEDQVRTIIEFCENVPDHGHEIVLINCEAGISRSAAIGIILGAVALGTGKEQEAVDILWDKGNDSRYEGNFFCPNEWIVECADRLLGRGGKLVEALYTRYYPYKTDPARL